MTKLTVPIWLFTVLRRLVYGLVWLATGWRVEGKEHVPLGGSLLVVSNHLSNGDPFLISVALPRPVGYMAKIELFRVPLVGLILRAFGTFPIDRGGADRQAMRHALNLLAAGHAVGMFPEGTRSRAQSMARGLPGVGMLALRSRATILPVAIFGSERPRLWPRPMVTVRFGRPLQLSELAESRPDNQAVVDHIMREIAALLPERYQGVYGASPATVGVESASGG